jgi:hypothetical protein
MNSPFTGWVIIVPLIALSSVWIIFDIFEVLAHGKEWTISWVIWTASQKNPIIPALSCLILGILIGHFWWNMC